LRGFVTEIQKKIVEVLKEINPSRVDESAINSSENLFEMGVLDSLTTVQVIIGLEKKFGLKISKNDIKYESFTTIEEIEKMINSKGKV